MPARDAAPHRRWPPGRLSKPTDGGYQVNCPGGGRGAAAAAAGRGGARSAPYRGSGGECGERPHASAVGAAPEADGGHATAARGGGGARLLRGRRAARGGAARGRRAVARGATPGRAARRPDGRAAYWRVADQSHPRLLARWRRVGGRHRRGIHRALRGGRWLGAARQLPGAPRPRGEPRLVRGRCRAAEQLDRVRGPLLGRPQLHAAPRRRDAGRAMGHGRLPRGVGRQGRHRPARAPRPPPRHLPRARRRHPRLRRRLRHPAATCLPGCLAHRRRTEVRAYPAHPARSPYQPPALISPAHSAR